MAKKANHFSLSVGYIHIESHDPRVIAGGMRLIRTVMGRVPGQRRG